MALFGSGIEAARVVVGVGVDGMAQASRDLQSFGRSVGAAGGMLTAGLTLPILAVGGAIISTATDFDTSMRRIVGLTNVGADEIDGVREAILGMAGEVGRAPQELGDAFYYLASAGLTTQTALDVLGQSARASAAGLGETQTIAQVTGVALNAFSAQGLDATTAIDALIAAVREGTAEPAEFAASLGTVAGSAAQLGATFPDVTAAMSAMTLRGISASEAAVSLNQVFVSLMKPTRGARKALEEMGLSAEGLRDMIGSQGLLPVLELLSAKFGGNEEAAAAVFGNIRALRGVLALTGGDAAQVAGVFERVNASTGSLADAFSATEGPGREMDRAMVDVQSTLVEFGQTVLPMVVDFLSGLRDVLGQVREWWDSLGDGMKRNVVIFAAVAAAIGPVLLIVGGLVTVLGLILSPIGLIIAAVVALGAAWATNFGGIRDAVQPIIDTVMPMLEAGAAAVGDVFGWIAANILPPLQAAFTSIAENVLPILQAAFAAIASTVEEHWPAISNIATKVGEFVKAAVDVISAVIQAVMPIIREIAEVWFPILGAAAGALLDAISTAFDAIANVADFLFRAIRDPVGLIRDIFNNLVGFVGQLPGRIGAAVAGMWDGILQAFKSVINAVIRVWNSLGFTIGPIDLGPLGKFGPWTIGTPNLPYLESGAWRLMSDTLAVLHQGEMVVPAGPAAALRSAVTGGGIGAGGGGPVIIVNIQTFYGTEQNVHRLSEELGREVRLATLKRSGV